MIIDGREYKKLVEENKKLREKNKKLRERYGELKFRLFSSTQYLDDFEYAVLLPKNSHTLKVWNDGRFEEKVVSVEVSQEAGSIPYFRIEK